MVFCSRKYLTFHRESESINLVTNKVFVCVEFSKLVDLKILSKLSFTEQQLIAADDAVKAELLKEEAAIHIKYKKYNFATDAYQVSIGFKTENEDRKYC